MSKKIYFLAAIMAVSLLSKGAQADCVCKCAYKSGNYKNLGKVADSATCETDCKNTLGANYAGSTCRAIKSAQD